MSGESVFSSHNFFHARLKHCSTHPWSLSRRRKARILKVLTGIPSCSSSFLRFWIFSLFRPGSTGGSVRGCLETGSEGSFEDTQPLLAVIGLDLNLTGLPISFSADCSRC